MSTFVSTRNCRRSLDSCQTLQRERNKPRSIGLACKHWRHVKVAGDLALRRNVAPHGAEVRDVADTWRIPLVLEAVVIAFAWKLTQWLGPAGLVRLGLLAECIRWTASGLTDDLVMLQWLQLGHGISVTGILIGIPMLLERDVARELRSTAQALSASIGNGVGAVLSNLLLGWALDHFDDGVPLLVAGFLQGGLLLASLRWLR